MSSNATTQGFAWRLFIGFCAFMLVVTATPAYFLQQEVVTTVSKTERVCSVNEPEQNSVHCKYLVSTDEITYENTDSLWFWKWNSSDINDRLQGGHTYRITTSGLRVSFMRWYPNIIRVEPIEG